ncbi:helicase-related protein [Fibrella aquatilis]|uniref:DEAD/DEAH box helicase family protein n=1 Tax=Fibrella aquatilis TaxID=2817059 RepID=A0A939G6H4_9BACT|nr:helicase-related protein [Fibrella aquatilis]MBO0932098.1 DEAD/DEAH box helicase family protein [Fibrella aquatilis]
MDQPQPRLIPDPETGKPLYGVGAGTVGMFLAAYYPEAQKMIRVATGYFRLAGYTVGRCYLRSDQSSVQFRILVGPKEGDNARLAVRDEIKAELDKGKKTGYYTPLVREVIRRIYAKEFIIYDARAMDVAYHCKFYICDHTVLCHGSGNYTVYGLLTQHEQASATRDPAVIDEFVDWFDQAAETAQDVTKPILQVLEEWLKLAPPFHAYLKFLTAFDIFFNRDDVPGLCRPVYYQQWIIARAIQDCREHRASIVLAATGLGKTIIGAELVFLLKHTKVIQNLILIAPSAVHAEWKKHLKHRGFHDELFSNSLLFISPSERAYHKIFQLDQCLSEASDKTLILIDEAHTYRNQDRSDWQKNHKKYRREADREKARGGVALDRIRPLVEEKKAIIVLLTATPYGTNPGNIESLLRFLPEALSNSTTDTPKKRKGMPLNELTQLAFVNSLGLRQVLTLARERGDVINNRVFIQFGPQRHFMPELVYLRRISYELVEFEDLRLAYDVGLFAQDVPNIADGFDEKREGYRSFGINAANSHFIMSWLGSPPAIVQCLAKNLLTLGKRDDQAKSEPPPLFPDYQRYSEADLEAFPTEDDGKPYGVLMKEDIKIRRLKLQPILRLLEQKKQDDKVQKLLELLKKHVSGHKEKVIVFVERHATALFVTDFLAAESSFSVECMVVRQGRDGYALKDADKRGEIMDNFSPVSRGTKKVTFSVDVLICTDANGIGVNLQDANVVVNYDPADSADILFQRAGRVLRFTADPTRKVHVYTFEPTHKNASSSACQKIDATFKNMREHHGRSKTTFGLSILPESDEEIIDLTNPEQEAAFAGSFNVADDGTIHDPLARHTALLDKHRELAQSLTDSLYSAMVYKSRESRIAVLIEQGTERQIILYNLRSRTFEHENDPVSIIDLIACQDGTDNAPIDMNTVERSTKQAVGKWLTSTGKPSDDLRILCGFYLAPRWKKTFATELLAKFIQARKKHHKSKKRRIKKRD